MSRPLSHNKYILARKHGILAIAYALPIILLGCVIWYLYHSVIEDDALIQFTQRYSDFNGTIFNGVTTEAMQSVEIRSLLFSSNAYDRAEGIRSILTSHMDPFFLLFVIFGGATRKLFSGLLFIRVGLAGASANHFVRKHVGVKGLTSLFISTVYALSGPVLMGVANSQIIDLAIILPIVLSSIDSYCRKSSIRKFFRLILSFALLAVSGIYGMLSGLLFIILGSITMVSIVVNKDKRLSCYGNIFVALIISICITSVVSVPSILDANPVFKFSDIWAASVVRYKMLDVLGTLFDGRILSSASVNGIPQLSLSITFLFLYVLFLINERIPMALKVSSIAGFLLIYLSISWSVVDEIFSIWGTSDIAIYSRIICYAALMLMYASISLRNITGVSRNEIYMAAAILFAVLIIHKANCDEVGPGTFSTLFSFGAVIFITVVMLFINEHPEHPLESILISVMIAGVFVNLIFVLGPSEYQDNFLMTKKIGNNDNNVIYTNYGHTIPLFYSDNDNEFILINSDITEAVRTQSLPEVINMAARTALMDDIFIKQDTYTLYSNGSTDLGGGMFLPNIPGNDLQITIRAYNIETEGVKYFVYSGFGDNQSLSLMYGEDVINTYYDRAFIAEITPTVPEFNLKLVAYNGQDESEFSLWRYSDENAQRFESGIKTFNNATINLSDIPLMNYAGAKTVITSINYDSKFMAVNEAGEHLNTLNVAGKLAVVITNPENSKNISIKVPTYDMITGLAISVISFVTVTSIYVIILKGNKKDSTRGAVNAKQASK